jgi:hypothetical protein
MRAYERALQATSTRAAPWYIVPADDKRNARLIISQIVNETLAAMKLAFPAPERGRVADLDAARRLLLAESG